MAARFFFENFQQDNQTSILVRYPGSKRAVWPPENACWPMRRIAVESGDGGNGVLKTGFALGSAATVDIMLNLRDDGNTDSQDVGIDWVFFNSIVIRGASATSLQFSGARASPTLVVAEVPSTKAIRNMVVRLDNARKQLTVSVDSVLVIVKASVNWVIDNANDTFWVGNGVAGFQSTHLPNLLESIVVATDLGDKMLTRDLQVVQQPLSYASSAGTVSDSDYEGIINAPVDNVTQFVSVPNTGTVEYAVDTDDILARQAYLVGSSPQAGTSLSINGDGGELATANTVLKPVPVDPALSQVQLSIGGNPKTVSLLHFDEPVGSAPVDVCGINWETVGTARVTVGNRLNFGNALHNSTSGNGCIRTTELNSVFTKDFFLDFVFVYGHNPTSPKTLVQLLDTLGQNYFSIVHDAASPTLKLYVGAAAPVGFYLIGSNSVFTIGLRRSGTRTTLQYNGLYPSINSTTLVWPTSEPAIFSIGGKPDGTSGMANTDIIDEFRLLSYAYDTNGLTYTSRLRHRNP